LLGAGYRKYGSDTPVWQRGAESQVAEAVASRRDSVGISDDGTQVASSDATNIETSIRREGDEYIVNGRKWWSSASATLDVKSAIVMGKDRSDGGAP